MVGMQLLFWYGFMYAIFKNQKTFQYTLTVVCASAGFAVPARFGFTYVQTALTFCFMIGLMVNKKDKYYTLQGLIFLPISFVPWIEATQCSNFLVHYGGHLWYDMSIPICILIYFYIVKSSSESEADLKDLRVGERDSETR